MDPLDIFALVVLLTIVLTVLIGAVFLGGLPGRIADRRGHPQADAVRACGWLGLLTLGVLWPIAVVWAYMKVPRVVSESADGQLGPAARPPADLAAEVRALKDRLVAVETQLNGRPSAKGALP